MEIDVKRLAKLSRISISAEQEVLFKAQMQDIVVMIENLPPLNSEDSPLDANDPMELREDIPAEPYARDALFTNAPQTQAGCVVVPKVIE